MVNQYCAHSFARNWQLFFLNQRKGENDRRKYFMIKSPWKKVADPAGVKLTTSWSPVKRTSNWATKNHKKLCNMAPTWFPLRLDFLLVTPALSSDISFLFSFMPRAEYWACFEGRVELTVSISLRYTTCPFAWYTLSEIQMNSSSEQWS